MPTAEQSRARAQKAARIRHHGSDAADVAEAREALDDANERARVDAHIDAVVASAPRLTESQASKLRALFAPL